MPEPPAPAAGLVTVTPTVPDVELLPLPVGSMVTPDTVPTPECPSAPTPEEPEPALVPVPVWSPPVSPALWSVTDPDDAPAEAPATVPLEEPVPVPVEEPPICVPPPCAPPD